MTSAPTISAVVLLAGADAAGVESLQPAAEILTTFGIGMERAVVDSHGQMPSLSGEVCAVIVASPDAALPAVLAVQTTLPVIRVPTASGGRAGVALLIDGNDNVPAGPTDGVFATMAIGEPGAKNAALFVVSSLAAMHEPIRTAWIAFRARQTDVVLRHPPLDLKD